MKYFLLSILALALYSCSIKKTESTLNQIVKNFNNPNYIPLSDFKGDTLKYLQTNFLEQKSFYSGKELSILLKDLELDIKGYTTGISAKNINLSPDLSVNFYTREQKEKKYQQKKNPLVLTIEWEIPLLSEDINFFIKRNHLAWTEEERNYFGQFKIKDIGMVVPNY